MSTEYRRGIPSTAHIEAATRLGLLWRGSDMWLHRFRNQNGRIEVCYFEDPNATSYWEAPDFGIEDLGFRPIRPGGTPVDWEVLDQEVARAGQQGQAVPWHPDYPGLVTRAQSLGWDGTGSLWGLCAWAGVSSENCAGPDRERGIARAINVLHAYITGREQTQSPAQPRPQGFRADLWARVSRHFSLVFRSHNQVSSLTEISSIDDVGIHSPHWQWGWGTADREAPTRQNRADILTRWTVYQELKPLYDLVDGAQGEAAMPRDVIRAWWDRAPPTDTGNDHCPWTLRREPMGLVAQGPYRIHAGSARGAPLSNALANFAAVLDAVAERRVAVRQAGQTLRQQLAELPQAVQAERAADEARRLQMEARLQSGPLAQPAQPEPRRFADVRPDRHAHKHWRIFGDGCGTGGTAIIVSDNGTHWDALAVDNRTWSEWDTSSQLWLTRTIIPTDEQGNPVSWEAAGFAAGAVRPAQEVVQRAANDATPGRATHPPLNSVTVNGSAAQGWTVAEQAQTGHIVKGTVEIAQVSVSPSRFALIELDDADPTAERTRQEQEAERHRLAELRQRLAAERAAQPTEETPATAARFDLIEPDPQADPAASIRAWEARQAAAKVRPVAAPPRIAKPAAAPRRPAIEVVDAEVDGLSRSEAFAALFGRALNGGC